MSRRVSSLERSQSTFGFGGIPLPIFDSSLAEQQTQSNTQQPRLSRPKKIARTKSMYMLNENILPVVNSSDIIPRITGDTLVDVLNGEYKKFYEQIFIIDCRFPYEYEAGHIPNAINSNSPMEIFQKFFDNPLKKVLIIFHCEFSQSRGPTMASLFRDHDRDLNSNRYPYLYYPEVYILDDGFKGFYEQHQDYCVGSYLRMHSDENINNGNLQHYNTLFKDEVEKVHEAKRGNLCNDSILASKYTNGCPTSPIAGHNSLDRKRSCLLASPIPLKRRL